MAFNPSNTTTTGATRATWLRASITGDITEVPGIGPASAEKLSRAGVTSTHGLVGKFLAMTDAGVSPVEHCERFYLYLQSVGVNAKRADVVQSIAEKVDAWMPGTYDEKAYED